MGFCFLFPSVLPGPQCDTLEHHHHGGHHLHHYCHHLGISTVANVTTITIIITNITVFVQVLNFLTFHCLWGLYIFSEKKKISYREVRCGIWSQKNCTEACPSQWPFVSTFWVSQFSHLLAGIPTFADYSPFAPPNPFSALCCPSLCSRRKLYKPNYLGSLGRVHFDKKGQKIDMPSLSYLV